MNPASYKIKRQCITQERQRPQPISANINLITLNSTPEYQSCPYIIRIWFGKIDLPLFSSATWQDSTVARSTRASEDALSSGVGPVN